MEILEPPGYWDNLEHRKEFLSSFAKTSGFDPLHIPNWRNRLTQIRSFGVILSLSFVFSNA